MIGYITLGTNDLPRAVKFYDALFASIGVQRSLEEADRFVFWSPSPEAPGFGVTRPYDGKAASVGNGTMIALYMPSPEAVDAFYHEAIALGASDEGAPGPRGDFGFYAGYFRDLDGNKLNAFHMASES